MRFREYIIEIIKPGMKADGIRKVREQRMKEIQARKKEEEKERQKKVRKERKYFVA